jgi:hypothetical protein
MVSWPHGWPKKDVRTMNAQLQVGWLSPELEGTTAGGERFQLRELRPRPVLVEFHRGTW